MSPSKAAKILRITRQAVHYRIKAGTLKAVRKPMPGGGFYYDVKLSKEGK